jgi:hypothetical protein
MFLLVVWVGLLDDCRSTHVGEDREVTQLALLVGGTRLHGSLRLLSWVFLFIVIVAGQSASKTLLNRTPG